jgi:hypothetical protein
MILAAAAAAANGWAQLPGTALAQPAAPATPQAAETAPQQKPTPQNGKKEAPSGMDADAVELAGRFFADQRAIWTSPARIHESDAFWLAPALGLGAALFATDTDVSRHLPNSSNVLNRSSEISNYGVGALVGAAGGMYLLGHMAHKAHWQETGFLSMESLASALTVNNAINLAAGRERPLTDNYRGSFWTNGRSFPSNHSVAAWSVASVIAHEYPGPLTKLLAYGLAAAVSGSRITAKQHFPSDVFAGAAIGWLVGQQIYRAHHDPDVGGEPWNSFGEENAEAARNPNNFGSPYVPLDSWVYPAFERLAALGYVPKAMMGERPWTRLECARLLDDVQDRIDAQEGDPPASVGSIYQALEREFTADLDLLNGGSNRSAELESVYARMTGISGQPLTDGYHFGQTIINDYGRPYAEGANADVGFSGWGDYGPLVGYIRGEYQYAPSIPALPLAARDFIQNADEVPGVLPPVPDVGTPSTDRFNVVEGYVGLNWENFQISAGRESLWWGPGQGGSMMFSNNAEPIDMVRIDRVTPFKLPSIFGLLGPIRVQFFVGRLSGFQFIFHRPPIGLLGQWQSPLADQPMIHGEKFSFKPTQNLEFGFDRATIFGGAGFPVTWSTFARSVFSLGNTVAGEPNKPGKRLSGFDMSYRLPGLRNWVTFYTDSLAYDQFTPVAYFDRSANSAGLYMPRLPKLPKFDFRVEGVYTDNPISTPTDNLCCGFYYSNETWISGYRNDGNIIGSWIGRDGQGAQAWLTWWHNPQDFLQLNFRHVKVSHQFVPDGGTQTDVGINTGWWLRPDLSFSGGLQYERWDFPILAPGQQTDVTASLQVTFWPRWRLH